MARRVKQALAFLFVLRNGRLALGFCASLAMGKNDRRMYSVASKFVYLSSIIMSVAPRVCTSGPVMFTNAGIALSAREAGVRRAVTLFETKPMIKLRQSNARQTAKSKVSPKAPLVDSALLRFLSAQKIQIVAPIPPPTKRERADREQTRLSQSKDARSIGNLLSKSQMNPTSAYFSSFSEAPVLSAQGKNRLSSFSNTGGKENTRSSNVGIVSIRDTSNDVRAIVSAFFEDAGHTDAELLSWFSQFNSNRIFQMLVLLGVDEGVALDAGHSVQNHALARTTRQRIRKFLRDRDKMWASESSAAATREGEKKHPANSVFSHKLLDLSKRDALTQKRYNVEKVILALTDFGLTGNDIAAIFTHTPSVAMMMLRSCENTVSRDEGDPYQKTSEEDTVLLSKGAITLEDILELTLDDLLCSRLKLRKYDARKVLRTCPGLLTMKGSRAAEQVISLMSSLGVSSSSLARDKASLRVLLSRPPALIFRLVAFLSSDAVRMPVGKIGPFIRRSECTALLDIVAPIPNFCLSLSSDLAESDIGNLVGAVATESFWGSKREANRHQIAESYEKMTITANALRTDAKIKDMGKILSAYSGVLLLDVDSHISPVLRFLRDDLGLENECISRVLESYPLLLGTSVTKMEEVVDFLRKLEVSEDTLESIFCAFPALLTLDVLVTMKPVVEFLRSIGVSNFGRFVTRLPPVLGYSVERELVPKWEYLTKVCKYDSFDVVRFPAYFSYPLERVIMTRYEYLRDVKRVSLRLVTVDDVLRFGDLDFATLVACDVDGGVAFANFAKERNSRPKRNTKNKTHGLNLSVNGSSKKKTTGGISATEENL